MVRAGKPEPPPTVVVQRGLLRVIVRVAGVVVPGAEVPIQARATGEIVSLPVDLGQTVKKGQRLLEVDPTAQTRALERGQADALEAQARLRMAQIRLAIAEREFKRMFADARAAMNEAGETLNEARTEFERVKQRRKDNQATEEQWRTAQRNADDARSRYDSAQARMEEVGATTYTLELQRQEIALREAETTRTKVALASARTELAKTHLVSPIDGIITECTVVRGQVIAPAALEAGMPVLTVSDLSKIAVVAEIDESQVRDIQPNLAATVVLPAFPDRRFQGRIVSIGLRGQRRGDKITFPIRIGIEGDPGNAARLGLTAIAEIVAVEKPDALLLENTAVRHVGNETSVIVLEQGEPVEKKVRLGRSDGIRSEVLEGLREGDRVVLP
ncbi:hypothetical protein AMJ85_07205 [candidate division BRC1 bacterium SM23_51]|nr:MAG: hypothetical protein AMJ85_07205 [candidate division BRC1 bacterium SM23_51]